jgi:BlaI family penicillinase repressor
LKIPLPTEGELAVLRVLWQRGPSAVREVHEAMDREVGYTTVLKLLQVMTAKGIVKRDERARAHVYRAAQSREITEARLVNRLADRAFGGSTANLVMRALSNQRSSPDELRRIRALLDQAEQKG